MNISHKYLGLDLRIIYLDLDWLLHYNIGKMGERQGRDTSGWVPQEVDDSTQDAPAPTMHLDSRISDTV